MTPIGTRVYRPAPLETNVPQADESRLAADLVADAVAASFGNLSEARMIALLRLLDSGSYVESRYPGRRVKLTPDRKAEVQAIVVEAIEKRGQPYILDRVAYSVRDGKIHRGLPT